MVGLGASDTSFSTSSEVQMLFFVVFPNHFRRITCFVDNGNGVKLVSASQLVLKQALTSGR